MKKDLKNVIRRLNRKRIEPYIREHFSYNPKSGVIRYKKSTGRGLGAKKAGDIAGREDHHGYVSVRIKRVTIPSHHLAWFLYYGVWPDKLDHRDRNRSNNRIKNLRKAKNGNQQNRSISKRNTSGNTGVSFHRASNRWRAFIYIGNKQKSLGYHTTKEDACKAYAKGKRKFHKFHPDVVKDKASYPCSTMFLK